MFNFQEGSSPLYVQCTSREKELMDDPQHPFGGRARQGLDFFAQLKSNYTMPPILHCVQFRIYIIIYFIRKAEMNLHRNPSWTSGLFSLVLTLVTKLESPMIELTGFDQNCDDFVAALIKGFVPILACDSIAHVSSYEPVTRAKILEILRSHNKVLIRHQGRCQVIQLPPDVVDAVLLQAGQKYSCLPSLEKLLYNEPRRFLCSGTGLDHVHRLQTEVRLLPILCWYKRGYDEWDSAVNTFEQSLFCGHETSVVAKTNRRHDLVMQVLNLLRGEPKRQAFLLDYVPLHHAGIFLLRDERKEWKRKIKHFGMRTRKFHIALEWLVA